MHAIWIMLLCLQPVSNETPDDTRRTQWSTEAQRLSVEGQALYLRGQFAEAARLFEKALDLHRKLYPAAQFPDGHAELAASLNNVGSMYEAAGNYAKAKPLFEQSLAMRTKLYPPDKFPDGHPQLATALNNLGNLSQALGDLAASRSYHERALAMRRNLYPARTHPDGHIELAVSLNNMGNLLNAMNSLEQAVRHYEEALAMRQRLFPTSKYPDGHVALATTMNNLASALDTLGRYEEALDLQQRTLAMRRRLYPVAKYPNGHPGIADSLNNLGLLLKSIGAYERSRTAHEEALAIRRKLYPADLYPYGHPQLARSLHNLAGVLEFSNYSNALDLYEQALRMRQDLYPKARYPDGHPDIASTLNNLGALHAKMGSPEKSVPYFEQAHAMAARQYPERDFPDGHPVLATGLNNLASVLRQQRAWPPAIEYYRRALDMTRKLYPASKYPNGHPELAGSLGNLAVTLHQANRSKEALTLCDEALAEWARAFPAARFPEGHPDFAGALTTLGGVYQGAGNRAKAADCFQKAHAMFLKAYPASKYPDGHVHLLISLANIGGMAEEEKRFHDAMTHFQAAIAMRNRLLDREVVTASESDALAMIRDHVVATDDMLSLILKMPESGVDAYRSVWDAKALGTRLLEMRHSLARIARPAAHTEFDRLKELRRRIELLLQESRVRAEDRERRLAELADERDRLERNLAQALPVLETWKQRHRSGPDDLRKQLPADAAFIDVQEYNRFDAAGGGSRSERSVRSYMAFVVVKDRPPIFVDLGPARAINEHVTAWRRAIDAREQSASSIVLRRLVWAKIEQHLPRAVRTVWVSPDSDLARMPWAALPARDNNRVLLEDLAIATVPHGPFLLEQLQRGEQTVGVSRALVVGSVEYGTGPWPALAGTQKEVVVFQSLFAGTCVTLSGKDATAARLKQELPMAGCLHLATHGQFSADELSAERKRDRELLSRRQMDIGAFSSRRVAAHNPLGFTGLVLANSEVISGLSVVDLPLDKLKLAVLSACETGLGDVTGGEGVQGLQRAFHLAGCPNVVASLWKVNDSATSALMCKFYHELWVNKKSPMEALRQAQLTILYRPDLVPDLSGERGVPKLREAVAVQAVGSNSSAERRRADIKLWAAFMMSGPGR